MSLARDKRKIVELLLLLLFSGSVAAAVYTAAERFPRELYDEKYMNSWFEADIDRVYSNMTDRASLHYRTKVHPLFSLSFCPAVYFFNRHLFHLPKVMVVHLLLALNAFGWVLLFYAAARMVTGRILDSACFTLLALSSASVLFWFAVPETFPFGSLTILVAIVFALFNRANPPSDWWYVGLGIVTMSMTITNWMAGIIVTFCQKHYKKAIHISIYAFAAVTLLWGVQKMIFPSAEFFIGDTEELRYVNRRTPGETLAAVILRPVVMPDVSRGVNKVGNAAVTIRGGYEHPSKRMIASGLWLILFMTGLWSLVRHAHEKQMRLLLLILFAGQFLLHIVYGEDTFLYSPHFLPLLILVAAFSSRTKFRKVVLLMVVVLTILTAANNFAVYSKSIRIMQESFSRTMTVLSRDGIHQ